MNGHGGKRNGSGAKLKRRTRLHLSIQQDVKNELLNYYIDGKGISELVRNFLEKHVEELRQKIVC